MARYVRALILADVGRLHREWQLVIAEAERANRDTKGQLAGTVRLLKVAYRIFNRELGELARDCSAIAEVEMRRHLDRSAKRKATGVGPHLRSKLRARPFDVGVGPFQTGAVGIGDEDAMNDLVDPEFPGAGPYWQTQEYGSTAHVGREIRGFFFDARFTNPTRPARGYTGNKAIAQPLFLPGSVATGPRGGSGGKGTIRQPIRARHFIRNGARDAEVHWRAGLARIEAQSRAAVRAARAEGAASRVRRRAAPRPPGRR